MAGLLVRAIVWLGWLLLSACQGVAGQFVAKQDGHSPVCGADGAWLQVLGSGGPEIDDDRASAAYLVWLDGRARVLIDAGPGASLRFGQAGANFTDLNAILISHWHVDHSADLPAFIKGSYFLNRAEPLQVLGPAGNRLMPSTEAAVQRLFGDEQGAYAYLGDYLEADPRPADYKIRATTYRRPVTLDKQIGLRAAVVDHGPIPALAWRIEVAGRAVVISGDMAEGDDAFLRLLRDADLFVAHHAIPEGSGGVARRLHMPPSMIGAYASRAGVSRVLLSHRMKRTLGRERESLLAIRQRFAGPVDFVDDLMCFQLGVQSH